MMVSTPLAAAWCASVPSTSSASIVGRREDRDVEGTHQLLDAAHLGAHVFRHLLAGGLVLRILRVAEGGADVKSDRQVLRDRIPPRR